MYSEPGSNGEIRYKQLDLMWQKARLAALLIRVEEEVNIRALLWLIASVLLRTVGCFPRHPPHTPQPLGMTCATDTCLREIADPLKTGCSRA
jgi:hypothetical protein